MTGAGEELPDLAGADWLHEEHVQKIFAVLQAKGGTARIVGGTVRNALMNVRVSDIDFAVSENPETVMELAKAARIRAVPTGIKHGTVTLISGRRHFEVTTLRRDVETDGRHAKVSFTDDWEADARRRDFTMNAIYCDAEGRLTDPVGGYKDILEHRVRFIGDARARIREDYLRTLRFFRFFAQYGKGEADKKSLQACADERAGLRRLSAERIHSELIKLLCAPRAVEAVELMIEAGIFTGSDLGRALPENFARLAKIEEGLSLAPDPILRLWVLLGGGSSPESRAEALAGRLRLSSRERSRLQILAAERQISSATPEFERRAALYALGRDVYQDHVLLNWTASGDDTDDEGWRDLFVLAGRWPVPEFPVQGADVVALGVAKGPAVGRILRELEMWWIGEGFPEEEDLISERLKLLAAGEQSRQSDA